MSAKKPQIYGTSVKKHKGYSVRILFKVAGKREPSGKYGVFAGKKKKDGEYSSIEESVKAIETLLLAK